MKIKEFELGKYLPNGSEDLILEKLLEKSENLSLVYLVMLDYRRKQINPTTKQVAKLIKRGEDYTHQLLSKLEIFDIIRKLKRGRVNIWIPTSEIEKESLFYKAVKRMEEKNG